MTKYILAGGADLRFDDFGLQLAEEVYRTVQRPAKILSCFFSTPSDYWGLNVETWQPWFRKYFGEDIMWMHALPDTFPDQIRAADVVYLHGGDNDLMLAMLGRYPQLPVLWKDKVVIGSSAGVNYLSRYFWRRRQQKITEGSGILPLSVMTHYESDDPEVPHTNWAKVEENLVALTGENPLRLREGHLRVVET